MLHETLSETTTLNLISYAKTPVLALTSANAQCLKLFPARPLPPLAPGEGAHTALPGKVNATCSS